MKTIEGTQDPVVYRMKKRDEMREQLATIIGIATFILSAVLIIVGFSLYERIYIALGGTQSASVADVLLGCLTIYLVALLLGLTVRWILIYKWVGRDY